MLFLYGDTYVYYVSVSDPVQDLSSKLFFHRRDELVAEMEVDPADADGLAGLSGFFGSPPMTPARLALHWR